MELTILMPCLDEAQTLETCIRAASRFLQESGISGEVLIADNGSTDGSQKIAKRAGARVVEIPERGYGGALLGGIDAARGKYVIMGDADASYDFTSLGPFVDRLRSGADLVVGNRFKGGIAPGAMPALHRYLGTPLLSFLGRLFFDVPLYDFHCGLRGVNTVRMRQLRLRSTGMEFASEMIVKAVLAGYRIEEVPTTLHPDGRSRRPHLRTWKDGWRHLIFLLLSSPRWLFIYPGLLLIALSAFLFLVLYSSDISFGRITLSTHTFVSSAFLLVAGVQALSLGIMARKFATVHELLPPPRKAKRLLDAWSLENALILAGILIVSGLFVFGWCIYQWMATDFGHLDNLPILRPLVLSTTMLTLGFQLALTAFVSTLIELRR